MPRRGPVFKNARANTIADKEIGLRMRAIRIDKKMSQEDLGLSLGVSFQQIQKYEKGVNRMSASRLMQIARTFGANPLELLGWNDKLERTAGTIAFDKEAYLLAKRFSRLPDHVKPRVRSLIDAIINDVSNGDDDD